MIHATLGRGLGPRLAAAALKPATANGRVTPASDDGREERLVDSVRRDTAGGQPVRDHSASRQRAHDARWRVRRDYSLARHQLLAQRRTTVINGIRDGTPVRFYDTSCVRFPLLFSSSWRQALTCPHSRIRFLGGWSAAGITPSLPIGPYSDGWRPVPVCCSAPRGPSATAHSSHSTLCACRPTAIRSDST